MVEESAVDEGTVIHGTEDGLRQVCAERFRRGEQHHLQRHTDLLSQKGEQLRGGFRVILLQIDIQLTVMAMYRIPGDGDTADVVTVLIDVASLVALKDDGDRGKHLGFSTVFTSYHAQCCL